MLEKLEQAADLIDSKNYQEAIDLLEVLLEDEPNHSNILNMLAYCWAELGRDATAYNLFLRSLATDPNHPIVTVNVGRCLHELGYYGKALSYFLKAAEIDPSLGLAYSNAAASLVQMSQWDDGIKCSELALECNPDDINAKGNLANCYLAKGDLERGWEAYELSLGGKYRKEWIYGDETRWDGEKDKVVVVYGEQGLGDEVYFAECLPELIRDSKEVHIDCDPRLAGLFARSFPAAKVHGTRRDISCDWLDDLRIDHRVSIGSLPKFYRKELKDYKVMPYLKADREKVLMWKALWASFNKPVIGICTKSGTKRNNGIGRETTNEAWKGFVEKHDAIFVSLEYRGDDPEFCKSYHFATRSNDYDDTAALIASMDHVIGICTTALHVADALGVPTTTLVPDYYNWKFGAIPGYGERVFQNGRKWSEVLDGIDLDL